MSVKECENCKEENPAEANFCRKCGVAFAKKGSPTFTLDVFKDISLVPVSIAGMRFFNRFCIFCFLFFSATLFLMYMGVVWDVIYHINEWMWEELYEFESYVFLANLIVVCLFSIHILVRGIKKLRFKCNAHYVEEKNIAGEMVRIAHYSRLGLFDKKRKKVLLRSVYTRIDKFDNNHLIISVGKYKGLYSIPYRRIIIPPSYDSITKGLKPVISAEYAGVVTHYDIKGNMLR